MKNIDATVQAYNNGYKEGYEKALSEKVEKHYCVREVARVLSVTKETVQRYIKQGKLKATKINGHWRVPQSELNRFINGRDDE